MASTLTVPVGFAPLATLGAATPTATAPVPLVVTVTFVPSVMVVVDEPVSLLVAVITPTEPLSLTAPLAVTVCDEPPARVMPPAVSVRVAAVVFATLMF